MTESQRWLKAKRFRTRVLRRLYKLERERVTAALHSLIAFENLQAEDAQAAQLALDWSNQGLDFADALHLASGLPAESFATFDTKLFARARRLKTV
jgi:predicted nucleic acid-binding protein